MELCNYNWNISTLISLRESNIYATELYPDLHDVVFFRLGRVLRFERKEWEKNFRYISTLITIDMSDRIASYYFDNEHNKIMMYFYNWVL